tara:strand:+ start:824 stop:1018 length:195 start_codon:yes stop_codon:yes gene_type:complete
MQGEPVWIFPFENMEIGESFFIPTLKSSAMIFAVESGAKRAGVRVRVYPSIKDECIGIRVWLTG